MLLSQWEGEKQAGADLNRKFHNTYVLAKIVGAPAPAVFYIRAVDVQMLSARQGESGAWLNYPLDQFDILKPVPDKGVYQYGEAVLLYRRNPARQFHEGLSVGTSSVLLNGDEELNGGLGWNVAEALFAPQQDRGLNDCLATLNKNGAVRINHLYWLKRVGDSTSLMRFRARIGTWASKQFFWSAVARRLFSEELKDELNFNA